MLDQIDIIGEGLRALAIVFVVGVVIRFSRSVIFELKELNKKLSCLEKQLNTIKDELTSDHRFDGVKEGLNAIARDVSCLDSRLENISEGLIHLNSDLGNIKDGVDNISSDVDHRRIYPAENLGT
jgi:uncharacterized protein YoxC